MTATGSKLIRLEAMTASPTIFGRRLICLDLTGRRAFMQQPTRRPINVKTTKRTVWYCSSGVLLTSLHSSFYVEMYLMGIKASAALNIAISEFQLI